MKPIRAMSLNIKCLQPKLTDFSSQIKNVLYNKMKMFLEFIKVAPYSIDKL